jgi:hypothetical protein
MAARDRRASSRRLPLFVDLRRLAGAGSDVELLRAHGLAQESSRTKGTERKGDMEERSWKKKFGQNEDKNKKSGELSFAAPARTLPEYSPNPTLITGSTG